MGNTVAVPAATCRSWSGVSEIGFGSTLGSSFELQFDIALDLLCDRLRNRYQGVGKGKARPGGGNGRVGLPPETSFVSAGFSSTGRGKALRPTSVSCFNIAAPSRTVHSLVVVFPLPPGTCP